MKVMRLGALALISTAVLLASPGASAAEKKALVGGRLIDGLLGSPISNSVILIDGETIEAVGTTDTLPVPPGYEQISTEGMTVMPGLWDMHVHLMITGHSVELSDDDNRGTVAVASAERMLVEQADAQMRGMLEKAEHVVVGRVSNLLQIAAAPSGGVISEHAPQWQSAVIEVTEAIKGGSRTGDTMTVRFASSIDVMWYDAPKLTVDQQGIFVIGDGRVMSGIATLAPESPGDAGTLISPGQVLPLSERERVRSMLR